MSTPAQPTVASTDAQTVAAYNQYLPSILQSQANAIPAEAAGTLQAAQQVQPEYNALNLQQLQQYGLPTAQVGQQIANSNALAGANTNLQQLTGPGGQVASSAAALNSSLNPVQGATNTAAQNLINSINLNGLSGGEQAAVERSLNQSNYATGNLGLDNATNAVSNAMNFGNALQAKRAALGSAISTGTNVASAQNAQFNPTNLALGQPNTSTASNFGTGTFAPTNAGSAAGSASNTNSTANAVFGGLSGNTNSILNNATQIGIESSPGGSGGEWQGVGSNLCCFIVMETYYGTLPWWIRECRDVYYKKYPSIALGYIKMANWLVPLMKKYTIIRKIVYHLMVKPLTQHGAYIKGLESGVKHRLTRKFWFSFWYITGGRK